MNNSIRTRLSMTFIGLATIPLLLVGSILAWQSFAVEQQQALNLQREIARRVATEVTAFFKEMENELSFASRAQVLPELDRKAQQNMLKLLMVQDVFNDVVLLDNQGQERIHLARLGLFSAPHSHEVGADEFFVPQTSGKVYYSPVRFGDITGEPLITIAVPLFDIRSGLPDGVLISEVRIKKIWDLIADIRISPGQSVYILDAQENVVAHRNPSVVLRDTRFPIPEHNGIQSGLFGEKAVLACETLHFGEQTFHVIAEQTVTEALALAINTVMITAILVVAALVIAGSLGFLSVRRIVRPIQAMASTAEAISSGDLSQQVSVISHDELDILANAFNSMTTQLRKIIVDLEGQIIERKQAEEALRESEQMFRAVAQNAQAIIFILDNGGIFQLSEGQELTKLGLDPGQVVGQSAFELYKDYPAVLESITEALAGELVHTTSVVQDVAFDAVYSPSYDLKGEQIGVIGIAIDITERKQAEDKIRQLNAELEDRVKARTAELEFVNRELKDFAYVVSHDLKAPLRAISRLASWLHEDYAQAFDEEGHEMVDMLVGRVKRLDNLIDGILEYSRIGRIEGARIPVDLNQLVADVLDSLDPPEHIYITVAQTLPTLIVENTRIFQVFQNLIGNAVKFINKPQGEIEIRCIEDEGYWKFSIADNGPGINPKHHDRIFQIFQTLHPRDEFESTGIGLALVKKIVEMHGGKIWLESTDGEGSQFFFTLPQTSMREVVLENFLE